MKTLEDYIRGYGFVPILLVLEYKHGGRRYSLTKQEGYSSYYFMEDKEVVFRRFAGNNNLDRLVIDYRNHKDPEVLERIKEDPMYKAFVKFVKERTGNDFHL